MCSSLSPVICSVGETKIENSEAKLLVEGAGDEEAEETRKISLDAVAGDVYTGERMQFVESKHHTIQERFFPAFISLFSIIFSNGFDHLSFSRF